MHASENCNAYELLRNLLTCGAVCLLIEVSQCASAQWREVFILNVNPPQNRVECRLSAPASSDVDEEAAAIMSAAVRITLIERPLVNDSPTLPLSL